MKSVLSLDIEWISGLAKVPQRPLKDLSWQLILIGMGLGQIEVIEHLGFLVWKDSIQCPHLLAFHRWTFEILS